MKLLLAFIILSTIATVSFAGDETSHSKTILPGSYITLKEDLILKANRDYIKISDRFAENEEGNNYFVASCELKVESTVPYDRKLSAGRTLAITKVTTKGTDKQYTYFHLENNSYIQCFGWGQKAIAIYNFRSMLSDSYIELTLNIPEL